jgi:7-cyano-7-deazaguanine synthase in queuosine biosynthesis
MRKLIQFDKLVFIDVGTEDCAREMQLITELEKDIEIVDLDLFKYELDNKIIPYRNHLFVLMAAQFGNEIYIGATAGDTTKDKDYVFKSQMEGILNYFAIDKHKVKVQEYPYSVVMPFKGHTKVQIVNSYLDEFDNPKDIEKLWTESRSCYAGEEKECGICRACLRKFVALYLNDVYIDGIFENDPVEHLGDFLNESIEKNRQFEIDDIKRACELVVERKK